MIQQIGRLAIQGATLFHKSVDATPIIGGIKGWTQQAITNNKMAREIVRLIIYSTVLMVALTLWKTFDLIMLNKVDKVIGALIGGIFTFYGGILAVTIPAFMNALKTVGPNQPVNAANNDADNKDLAAGNKP